MSVFKKTCFVCGKKVDNLIENKCRNCFSQGLPPIKEIKPMNLRICNMCKKIHYKNGLFTLEEIEKMLPMIAEKYLVLNPYYILKILKIENFELVGNKIIFDINVDCDIKK